MTGGPDRETLALLTIGEWDQKLEGRKGEADYYRLGAEIVGERFGKVTFYRRYKDAETARDALNYALDRKAGVR